MKILFLLTIPLLIAAHSLRAEDSVWYSSAADSRNELKAAGTILDFNRRELIIKGVSGRETAIAADRVRRLEFARSAAHQAADQAFESGEMDKAKSQYAEGAKGETRPWAWREMAAQVVRCWTARGDQDQSIEKAGALFLELAREDLAPPVFAAMPLAWTDRPVSPALSEQAKKWRASDSIEGQLIGASWLLTTDREASVAVLGSLASNRDSRIADLAKGQLWRTEISTADRKTIERWQKGIDLLSPALRGGPWFVVGLAWARQQEPGRAALAFMRVPIQFPAERLLGSEALLAAADQLVLRQEKIEAKGLWQEIVTYYPGSPAARLAAEKLKR